MVIQCQSGNCPIVQLKNKTIFLSSSRKSDITSKKNFSFCRDFEASVDGSFPQIRSSVNRTRDKVEPSLKKGLKDSYKTMKEFTEDVEKNPGCLSYADKKGKERKLEGVLINSSTNGSHYLLYDEAYISEFGGCISHFDATFFCRIKIGDCQQFFTIMAKKYNEVSSIYGIKINFDPI